MQTSKFVDHINQIATSLKVDQLTAMLVRFLDAQRNLSFHKNEKDEFANLIFESNKGLGRVNEDSEKLQIVSQLGISYLYAPTKLTQINNIIYSTSSPLQITSNNEHYKNLQLFLTELQALSKLRNVLNDLLSKERQKPESNEFEVLEIEIIDYENDGVPAVRLNRILAALQNLHDTIARILNEKDARLKISFLDSGSDIVVAIQSAVSVMEFLKSLFNDYWHKRHSENFGRFKNKLEAIEGGFTLIDYLHQQQKEGKLTPEDFLRYKHNIVNDMDKLTGYGATLKVLEAEKIPDVRAILLEKRDVKLLENPTNDSNEKYTTKTDQK